MRTVVREGNRSEGKRRRLTGNVRHAHPERMSRKTISIDQDAYDILVEAKETPSVSFSDAIRAIRNAPRIRTVADMLKYENEIFGNIKKNRHHARQAAF